jgi:hypothetical protein
VKKNTKKQLNPKSKLSSQKRKNILLKPKKRRPKLKKASISVKSKKSIKSKTKAFLKKTPRAILNQKAKKNIRKTFKKTEEPSRHILTFGNIQPNHSKILLLVVAIIFATSFLILQTVFNSQEENTEYFSAIDQSIIKNIRREKEINTLVRGYPIEKMTPYIAKQDSEVVAFLIAIAKKESAWGKRKPVLNGEDCYNYWGFRLKSDRVGSGGHTCFDSPEEAVEIVAARIKHLIDDEKIDTPEEMIIWKCGYACQNTIKSPSEQKWISDVSFYYDKMTKYL